MPIDEDRARLENWRTAGAYVRPRKPYLEGKVVDTRVWAGRLQVKVESFVEHQARWFYVSDIDSAYVWEPI